MQTFFYEHVFLKKMFPCFFFVSLQVNGDHLEPLINPSIQVGSALNSKEEESLVNQLRDASLLPDSDPDHSWRIQDYSF